MARRGSDAIDGFAYVQAMKRASARSAIKPKVHDTTGREMPPGPSAAPAGGSTPEGSNTPPKRAGGRVAVPVKRLVICYACGYSHTLAGKMHHAFCPKCKTELNTEDITVSGKRSEDILTIGDVTLTTDAEFDPGLRVTGRRVVVDGDVTALASITAMDRLELCSNVRFGGVTLINPSGRVDVTAGESVVLDAPLTCAELHVHGRIHASVTCGQVGHVHPGGVLEGAYKGPSLIVEDGGGLIATVDLDPRHAKPPEAARTPAPGGVTRTVATLANAMLIGFGLVAGWLLCLVPAVPWDGRF